MTNTVNFALSSNKKIIEKLNLGLGNLNIDEGVILFKKFDEGHNVYYGSLDDENKLKDFVDDNKMPLIIEFTQEVSFYNFYYVIFFSN